MNMKLYIGNPQIQTYRCRYYATDFKGAKTLRSEDVEPGTCKEIVGLTDSEDIHELTMHMRDYGAVTPEEYKNLGSGAVLFSIDKPINVKSIMEGVQIAEEDVALTSEKSQKRTKKNVEAMVNEGKRYIRDKGVPAEVMVNVEKVEA